MWRSGWRWKTSSAWADASSSSALTAGAGVAASALAGGTVLKPERAVAGVRQPTIPVVGAGLAGLRCAHRLYAQKGWISTIYEATSAIGGRGETQRGYWRNSLIAEMHGEFISSEHSSMLGLASLFNLSLDTTRTYAADTADTYWVNGARYTQAQLDVDWQSWAWNLFQWAIKQAPWPQSYNSYNATGYAWDHMSVPEWINQYMPGGTAGNFAAVCLQNVIDEYGGDPSDQSALNLTMILGYYDSKGPWVRGQYAPFPYSAGTDELYHITGGTTRSSMAWLTSCPRERSRRGRLSWPWWPTATGPTPSPSKAKAQQVTVDSVVLTLPFKTLRNVDLSKAGYSPLKRGPSTPWAWEPTLRSSCSSTASRGSPTATPGPPTRTSASSVRAGRWRKAPRPAATPGRLGCGPLTPAGTICHISSAPTISRTARGLRRRRW